MDDSKITISTLKDSIDQYVKERDWGQFHSPKNLSMAIAAEAGELMELFTYATIEESEKIAMERKQEFQHELADIIIACFALANKTNTDISSIVKAKIEEIKKKYPIEKAKGKWTKYTDYKS